MLIAVLSSPQTTRVYIHINYANVRRILAKCCSNSAVTDWIFIDLFCLTPYCSVFERKMKECVFCLITNGGSFAFERRRMVHSVCLSDYLFTRMNSAHWLRSHWFG